LTVDILDFEKYCDLEIQAKLEVWLGTCG